VPTLRSADASARGIAIATAWLRCDEHGTLGAMEEFDRTARHEQPFQQRELVPTARE